MQDARPSQASNHIDVLGRGEGKYWVFPREERKLPGFLVEFENHFWA